MVVLLLVLVGVEVVVVGGAVVVVLLLVLVGVEVVVVGGAVVVVLLVVGGGGGGWSVYWEMKVFVQPSTGCQTGPGPSGGMQKQPWG